MVAMAQMLHHIATNQNNNIMNRLFIIVAVVATIVGCSAERRWGIEERRALREDIRTLRDMAYLDNLTEVEFDTFAGDVIEAIEIDYPVYTTFVELPSRGDTVEVYVVTTIVEALNANPHNLRNLYPYAMLVGDGILPAGLSHQALRAYYDCLSYKVRHYYPTTFAFYTAVADSPTTPDAITAMLTSCAAELFDYVNEELVISSE